MTRRSLTAKEREAMVAAQNFTCGCGCGQPVDANSGEGEHFVCVFFGNESKPDAMWRSDCHKVKTAQDKKAIAKCKRILRKAAGTWKPNRQKIQSRGFQKRPADSPYQWPTRKLWRPF